MMRKRFLSILLVLVVLFPGCAGNGTTSPLTSQEVENLIQDYCSDPVVVKSGTERIILCHAEKITSATGVKMIPLTMAGFLSPAPGDGLVIGAVYSGSKITHILITATLLQVPVATVATPMGRDLAEALNLFLEEMRSVPGDQVQTEALRDIDLERAIQLSQETIEDMDWAEWGMTFSEVGVWDRLREMDHVNERHVATITECGIQIHEYLGSEVWQSVKPTVGNLPAIVFVQDFLKGREYLLQNSEAIKKKFPDFDERACQFDLDAELANEFRGIPPKGGMFIVAVFGLDVDRFGNNDYIPKTIYIVPKDGFEYWRLDWFLYYRKYPNPGFFNYARW